MMSFDDFKVLFPLIFLISRLVFRELRCSKAINPKTFTRMEKMMSWKCDLKGSLTLY